MFFRSVFFVPGDSEKKIAKSHSIAADLPVFDLEDSVLSKHRAVARERVASAIRDTHEAGRQCAVRINALDSDDAAKDLAAVVAARPEIIMLPKIRSANDVDELASQLDVLERSAGIDVGKTRILAIATETPQIMFAMGGLQSATERLVALTWGAEDLSTALGASRNKDANGHWTFTFQMVRSQCLIAARAAGLQPVDTLYADFRDETGLRNSCLESRQDGFTGKLAIHPAQVDVVNECFMPSTSQVEFARRVVDTFAANPEDGAVQLDGKMLDIPHLKYAHAILEQHAYYSGPESD